MPAKRRNETDVIVRYLISREATPRLATSYERAMGNINITFSKKQDRLWKTCLAHPWILPYIDAWLAVAYPDHPIRKKMFVMLCILETQPDFSDFFLPIPRGYFYLLRIMYSGVASVIKIFIGRLITWAI